MKILMYSSILVNIIALMALCFAMSFNSKSEINPKQKANIGYFVCFSMIIYMLFVAMAVIFGLLKHSYFCAILIIFMILPFLIGKYSSYTKVKQYSLYQVMSYLGSLFCLICLALH